MSISKTTVIFFLFVIFSTISVSFGQNNEKIIDSIDNQKSTDEYKKFRFGGYGEMLFEHMDYGADRYKDPVGAPKDKRSYISIPRTIFAIDYKFRDDIILGTEIEFEYGGTGTAMELEYDEAGEYEMEVEKGGEVVLEQFHLTKRFTDWLNIRVGHMIVPIGITNAHHEPIFFFGSSRPEGEMTIIPCTWHETGISILGKYGNLRYEAMVVNGLDPNGFSSIGWINGGKQGIFEKSVMTSPAFAGRVEYIPIKGLRIGVSGYYNKTAKNASMPQKTKDIKAPVTIGTFDAQYLNKNIAVRANLIYGHLGDSKRLSQINKNIAKATQFSRTPVAEEALTYSIEAGYNIFSFFNLKQKLMPFVRYEYYNSMESVEDGMQKDLKNKRDVFTFGLNYYILPNLVLKADYSMRKLDKGNFNQENTFGFAVAYTGWFIKK